MDWLVQISDTEIGFLFKEFNLKTERRESSKGGILILFIAWNMSTKQVFDDDALVVKLVVC